ncbi:Putative exported protein [Cronobacter sakazakii 680]|nr:Putative exported protein [Cronobacter sakazakii 680]
MKRGIKALCLAVALAGGTFCTAAIAAPSAGKTQAEPVKEKNRRHYATGEAGNHGGCARRNR